MYTPKVIDTDVLLEWVDAVLDQEIVLLLTWVQGDGDQKPPSSIAEAMHNHAAELQEVRGGISQLRERIRHDVEKHRVKTGPWVLGRFPGSGDKGV
jgi:hypothetical protein